MNNVPSESPQVKSCLIEEDRQPYLLRTWRLYELVNPITKETRYVGITQLPLDQRLQQHLQHFKRNRNKWALIDEMKQYGCTLEIVEICDLRTFNKREAEHVEAYYIQTLTKMGVSLVNFRRAAYT